MMLLKALAGVSCLLVSAPVATASVKFDTAAIVQVSCPVAVNGIPIGAATGTAFKIGRNFLVSVKHVTTFGNCSIGGLPIQAWQHPGKDFSLIQAQVPGPSLDIDCNGYVKGRRYLAIGYARGRPFQTTVELEGTGETYGGFDVLKGMFTVIPGMSGGPVIDAETGKVVGVINVYNFQLGHSGSIPLRDTSLCAKA